MNTQARPAERDPAKQLLEWASRRRRLLVGIAAGLALAAASVWFVLEYQQRKEAAGVRALDQARSAAQSGNLPLAASDLARLIDSYQGTAAADEGVILLAQVRLLQDQPDVATELLRRALERGVGDQFRGPAYGLLGTALEEQGQMIEAAEAYRLAAETAWYDFLKAQYLNDAGRAFAAGGDTARAVSAYERVLREFEESPSALEASVRVAELKAASANRSG